MEKPEFSHIVISLAQTAYVNLGTIEDPFSKQKKRDLEQAKFTIDLLEVLQEKTKGNLLEDEEKLLEEVLYDLRMKYLYEMDREKKQETQQ